MGGIDSGASSASSLWRKLGLSLHSQVGMTQDKVPANPVLGYSCVRIPSLAHPPSSPKSPITEHKVQNLETTVPLQASLLCDHGPSLPCSPGPSCPRAAAWPKASGLQSLCGGSLPLQTPVTASVWALFISVSLEPQTELGTGSHPHLSMNLTFTKQEYTLSLFPEQPKPLAKCLVCAHT